MTGYYQLLMALKMAVSGKKTASKEEVASGVRSLMPLATSRVLREFVQKASLQEHCWDALGAILASMKTEKFRLLKAGLSEKREGRHCAELEIYHPGFLGEQLSPSQLAQFASDLAAVAKPVPSP